MKKSFIIAIAAMVLATTVAVVSCKKEKKNPQDPVEAQVISKEDDMSAYLKQFKERMQSSSKNGETLTTEDACWHLEAVLNYTYGDAGHLTSDIQCDTFYLTIQTNGGEVSLFQLNDAFNNLSHNVEKAYGNCTLPEKSILGIQTTFENENKDGNITVRSILSTRGFDNTIWPPRFGPTDYWDEYYLEGYSGGGKCGPYEGECPESGAPNELTKKLRLRFPNVNCNGTSYYTDLSTVLILIDHADPFFRDENSPCGYKLHYNEREHYETNTCIDPDGMNYYLSKGMEIIDHFAPNGKTIVSAKYMWSLNVGIKENRIYATFHYIEAQYGVLHCNPQGGSINK